VLLVVAMVLPSLLVMSRTSAYLGFRIIGAAFAYVASAMWIAERLLGVQTHVDAVVDLIAHRGLACADPLFAVSLVCLLLARHSEGWSPVMIMYGPPRDCKG
jgi:hypothetical protein